GFLRWPRSLLLAACCLVLPPLAVPAPADLPDAEPSRDFLRRPPLSGYVNYGQDMYRPYRREIRLQQRYDYLGNYLTEGFLVYELDEQRPGRSNIRKDRLYRSLNNLVIAHDSYGPWDWALTVGDEVRTQFTPLTLRQAGFNGLRWDVVFPANQVSLLVTRGYDASLFPTLSTFSTPLPQGTGTLLDYIEQEEENPVYNLGGHWQTRVGDVLRFGATLVNQHQVNTASGSRGSLLAGSIPYPEMQAPHEISVRIRDDTPTTDEQGAVVYDVFLEVQGDDGGTVWLSSDPDSPDYDASLAPEILGGRRGDGYREVRGEETVEYTFTLPDSLSPRQACVRAVVANDYRLETRQQHPFYVPLLDRDEPRTTPYQTVARASGEVADFSNRREVDLNYGLYTGQTLYGVDFEATLVGLQMRGEYERNLLYRAFPVRRGATSQDQAAAWYVTVLRDLGPLELGGEVFRLDAHYSGGYDARRGGVLLYTDKGGETRDVRMLSEFPLVDDNDDDDRYADDNLRDYPNGAETESGVFPGLDENNDHIPDDDQNANGTPDYEEPFLLYFSDPQEFVYGVDLNNNGVIDARENDNEPDYPYKRDRKGWHAFVSLAEREGLSGAVGYYRQDEIAGAGRAVSRYGRLAYRFDVPRWARLQLNHDSKRVEDTIPDPVFIYRPGEDNNPDQPPSPDPLHMADSWVHTTFAGTQLTRWPGLVIENNGQWLLNRQLALHGRLQTVTLVNKADYTWKRGRLVVQPMAKHLYKRVTRTGRHRALESWHQIAPILRLDVRLTEKSSLQFGQQGMGIPFTDAMFGPLAFRLTDAVDEAREYRSADSVLMFTVKGDYQGYTVVSNTGLQKRHEAYSDPAVARTRDGGFSRFFISVIAGYDR
ncbi:MAG: hypothetical protein AB1505_29610, partial [Candidatus Latescibacterota bacterium]